MSALKPCLSEDPMLELRRSPSPEPFVISRKRGREEVVCAVCAGTLGESNTKLRKIDEPILKLNIKIAGLDSQLKTRDDEIGKLRSKLSEKDKKLQKKDVEIEQLRSQLRPLQEENDNAETLQTQLKALKTKLKFKDVEIEDLHAKNEILKKTVHQLKDQLRMKKAKA